MGHQHLTLLHFFDKRASVSAVNYDELQANAWLGDAVLALFARQWLLTSTIPAKERPEAFIQLTSNQFLASLGGPTRVEATIGTIYQTQGLEAAFHHIETTLLPLYLKQRRNQTKGLRGQKPKRHH